MISGEQIRAGRALVGISGRELSEMSGISYPTIQRIESSGTDKSAMATVKAILNALESRGVQFLDTGEVALGAGVALRDREDD